MSLNPESLALLQSLLARPNPADDARAAFAKAYPDAPQEMIDTAVHHLITDGLWALTDFLAAIESFLRHPGERLDYGAAWHLLYHLYNFQQFEALLPLGRHGLRAHLADIQHLLNEDDKDAALATLKSLSQALSGDKPPPTLA